MSKGAYPLKLPTSVRRAAERLAREDGVSLNQWIATAVAQKIGVVETAAEFFRQRAGDAAPLPWRGRGERVAAHCGTQRAAFGAVGNEEK